jgi:hypothetical protein
VGTNVAEIPWAKEAFEDFGRLIEYQQTRFTDRVAELVIELYGDRDWTEGEIIRLPWPDDARVIAAEE